MIKLTNFVVKTIPCQFPLIFDNKKNIKKLNLRTKAFETKHKHWVWEHVGPECLKINLKTPMENPVCPPVIYKTFCLTCFLAPSCSLVYLSTTIWLSLAQATARPSLDINARSLYVYTGTRKIISFNSIQCPLF